MLETSPESKALAVRDLTIIDDEPRVQDLRLGKRLGFKRVRKIRDLIERNKSELEAYGTIAPRRGDAQIGSGATRQVAEYHLNEEQALLVCMFARTPQAAAVRREVIGVFVAWRRGETAPRPAQTAAWMGQFRQNAEDIAAFVDAQDAARRSLALNLTTAPIWKGGRRPVWWPDIEVRQFLTVMHRQMTIDGVIAVAKEKFGADRTPSKSSLHRFWVQLDGLFGGRA